MPFCQTAHAIRIWKDAIGHTLLEDDSLVRSTAAEAGNGVHQAWQNWLGTLQVIYGDWECRNPWCPDKGLLGNYGYERQCPRCKWQRDYRELYYKTPFGMKIDGPIRPAGEDRITEVCEFKTIGQKEWDEITAPKLQHAVQLRCYVDRLQEDNFDIRYGYLVYVSRDRPWTPKIFAVKQIPSLSRVVGMFDRSEKRAKRGMIPEHKPPYKDACKYCMWKSLCYSPTRQRTLEGYAAEYAKNQVCIRTK